MSIARLQHASVPRPPGPGGHRRAVDFYCGVLGLEEIPTPHTFGDSDVTWFKVGNEEIHVYGANEDSPRPHTGAHFCLVVDDLTQMRARLEEAGYPTEEASLIPHRPRFYAHDPFGNGIEFTTIEGDYLS